MNQDALPWVRVICVCILVQLVFCQTNEVSETDESCVSQPCSCCLNNATCYITLKKNQCADKCKDGYVGGNCWNRCPDNCFQCRDPYNPFGEASLWGLANCTTCKEGHYSTHALIQCQLLCPVGCRTCDSNTACTSCKDGYYLNGTLCRYCPAGCASCTDYSNCTQCQKGYYSQDRANSLSCVPCSRECQSSCSNNSCRCRLGFIGERCDKCVPGWYGADCRSVCRTPCRSCASIKKCTSCFNGYYLRGKRCHVCPARCVLCSSFENCTHCKIGHYGKKCQQSCQRCSGGTCEKGTGACISGCTSGYSGDMCCLKGANCRHCASASNCSSCVEGKYGDTCNTDCPRNCERRICHKKTGSCARCVNGFEGENCSFAKSTKVLPVAVIGGGVAVAVVVISVVVLLVIICRRMSGGMAGSPIGRAEESTVGPVYANVGPSASTKTRGDRTPLQDTSRQQQQQQQQQHRQQEGMHIEMGDMSNYVNSGATCLTYESLKPDQDGDHLYTSLGTN